MQLKKDILWRVYLSYLLIIAACIAVVVKAFIIQQVQGDTWRSMSDSLHQKIQEINAERGTIYSADGKILSTSIPRFDLYVDFGAEGLRMDKGKVFFDNLDSLSYSLAALFKDRSKAEYKRLLSQGYKKENRYFLVKKKVTFDMYQQLKTFPLIRLGRYKSGFIAEADSIRLNPYGELAKRTIGLDRANAQKVGLEQTYDTLLSGLKGQRLVRYIAGGAMMPVSDAYIAEPENGKDIITTIDTRIQETAEKALYNMVTGNEAEHGCAIVMEVKTGAIKAIANIGKNAQTGVYSEDYNYAVIPSEPGSTFKLATLLSVLEDKKYSTTSMVNLEYGKWQINRNTVFDSEPHGRTEVTVKKAFELSSNVGMAKLAYNSYASNPMQFINHLHNLGLDSSTGIDLFGEKKPLMYKPGSPHWSAISLPWMAFGYGILVTPMHTAILYNTIANNGKMMKPYLMQTIEQDGIILKRVEPIVTKESICSAETLKQLQTCLKGVCNDSPATAYRLFKGTPYKVAGKTGTALVANGARGYADHIYQSSFAGYFPADNPQYTIVVVIKNKAHAAVYYGASVAGPVFKEISDRLYSMTADAGMRYANVKRNDSFSYAYNGMLADIRQVTLKSGITYKDSTLKKTQWASLIKTNGSAVMETVSPGTKDMPLLSGLSLKDAVYVCENMGLKVIPRGKGRVVQQSISPGQAIAKGQTVSITLN